MLKTMMKRTSMAFATAMALSVGGLGLVTPTQAAPLTLNPIQNSETVLNENLVKVSSSSSFFGSRSFTSKSKIHKKRFIKSRKFKNRKNNFSNKNVSSNKKFNSYRVYNTHDSYGGQ